MLLYSVKSSENGSKLIELYRVREKFNFLAKLPTLKIFTKTESHVSLSIFKIFRCRESQCVYPIRGKYLLGLAFYLHSFWSNGSDVNFCCFGRKYKILMQHHFISFHSISNTFYRLLLPNTMSLNVANYLCNQNSIPWNTHRKSKTSPN